MPGRLYEYLAQDHAVLGQLLEDAISHPGGIDLAAYESFRAGLLRHIGIEERILFPMARRMRGGEPLPIEARLHRDHAALAALLVPPPTMELLHTMKALLERHNDLEERTGGLYELCEALVGEEPSATQLRAAPAVPVAPHVDSAKVHENIRLLLDAVAAAPDERGGD